MICDQNRNKYAELRISTVNREKFDEYQQYKNLARTITLYKFFQLCADLVIISVMIFTRASKSLEPYLSVSKHVLGGVGVDL